MTPRKASRETLERLAQAVDCEFSGGGNTANVRAALSAYRAETAPLRPRSEVDAEIAALTRQCVDDEWAGDDDYAKWEKVTALCREPTAPEPEPAEEPEPCSCEEALALRDRITNAIKALRDTRYEPSNRITVALVFLEEP